MKTTYKYTILGILIASFYLPILSATATLAPAQTEHRFRIGTTSAPDYAWDIPITRAGQVINGYFVPWAMEPLIGLADDYDRGISEGVYKADTYIPVLATNWTIDFWPAEMNSKGFINRGGVANMTLKLREGVKFHDGSDWNATVAKWNIDRCYIITGNLTGNGDTYNKDIFWIKANEWKDYYTPGWNMSSYGETGAYGYYGIYSNPSTTTYQRFPSVKQVVITDDKQSGGEIRIEWNDFNSVGMTGVGLILFISMASYADYWDNPIRGYLTSDPAPAHMIGTGPYIYEFYDPSGSPGGGYMRKNLNYWNRTALEADGWFDADYIDVITWPQGTLGIESRNTALMTHALDYALDYHWTPVDYNDVMAEPRLNYIERPVMDNLGTVSLNAINETWWSWPGYRELVEVYYPTSYPSGNTPNGVPRAMRKAMSYCFDYDTYLNVAMENRYVRSSSIGINNLYYNPDIPIATHDLTIARNTLLNDPLFGPRCVANGLTINSTNLEWQNVANSVGGKTPLWVLDFYWDDQYEIFKGLFQTNLKDIGVTLKDPTGATNKVSESIWAELSGYWIAPCFPVFSAHAWPLDYTFPSKSPEGVTEMYFSDPSNGIWRTQPGSWWLFDWFPWWNLHFGYNETVEGWIKQIYLSNDTSKQHWYNLLQDHLQNYQYNGIFVGQHKQGAVHWKDWEISTYWGSISYQLTRYVGFGEEFPEIPGFLTGILTSVSILTMVGLVYVMRRRLRFK